MPMGFSYFDPMIEHYQGCQKLLFDTETECEHSSHFHRESARRTWYSTRSRTEKGTLVAASNLPRPAPPPSRPTQATYSHPPQQPAVKESDAGLQAEADHGVSRGLINSAYIP